MTRARVGCGATQGVIGTRGSAIHCDVGTVTERSSSAQRDAPHRRGSPPCYRAPAMKSLTEHLVMNIPSRRGFENITHEAERIVRASGCW